MGAYQHSVRTGGVTGGRRGRFRDAAGGAVGARSSVRRPVEGTRTNEFQNYFNDVLMQRFGGDDSLDRRLRGLMQGQDPRRVLAKYSRWSRDPYKDRFSPVSAGGWPSVDEQYDALSNMSQGWV